VGIVGAKLVYPDRVTIQHAGVCVGMFGAAEHYGKFLRPTTTPGEQSCPEVLWCNHEVAAVTAACMLVRKDAFDKIGGFDESLAVGFGDVDLCLRVREHGFCVIYCAHAKLIHHESYTRGKSTVDPHPEDSALFQSKWRDKLSEGDPYFNPGFSLVSTAWQHANPLPFNIDIKRRVFVRG
jgi:GT2 family glycosyltransferase